MNDEATHEVFEDEVQNWREYEDACSAGFKGSRVDYLLKMLRRQSWEARLTAARMLARWRLVTTVDPLIGALEDEHPEVRSAAAEALGEIGDDRAAGPLHRLYADPDSKVRRTAAIAAERLKQLK